MNTNKPYIPNGMWLKCPRCQEIILDEDLGSYKICPACDYLFRLQARERLQQIADIDSFVELFRQEKDFDPLSFPGYKHKKTHLRAKTQEDEAILTGQARIAAEPCYLGIMDTHFLMGSMGQAVGEKVTLLFEEALKMKKPVVLFVASGGARMQEGTISLMQMAKTMQAVKKHANAKLFYLAVLTDPTTGGVSASFAQAADIILAEPEALIGFAGRRVIEQALHRKMPKDFQTAEYQLKHGFIDQVVPRPKLKTVLGNLLAWHH